MSKVKTARAWSQINVTAHNSITNKRDRSRNRSRKNVTNLTAVTEKTLPVTFFKTLRDRQNATGSKDDIQCHSGHTTTPLYMLLLLFMWVCIYGGGGKAVSRDHSPSSNRGEK